MERTLEQIIERAQLVVPGAVSGDIIGSSYEFNSTKDYDFPLLTSRSRVTDDSVCTTAIAEALLNDTPFEESLRTWGKRYPRAGYGGTYRRWLAGRITGPYNSWGNGSAMRVSPVGAYARTCQEAMYLAEASAAVTHNHPEGIKGAQATAAAIFYALRGNSKEEIKARIEADFGYDLSRDYETIQPGYTFDVSCMGSVPEAMICFLKGHDYESTIRLCVAMGGDADTMAAIAGGIAAAYYGEIPAQIMDAFKERTAAPMLKVIEKFNSSIPSRYGR